MWMCSSVIWVKHLEGFLSCKARSVFLCHKLPGCFAKQQGELLHIPNTLEENPHCPMSSAALMLVSFENL